MIPIENQDNNAAKAESQVKEKKKDRDVAVEKAMGSRSRGITGIKDVDALFPSLTTAQ